MQYITPFLYLYLFLGLVYGIYVTFWGGGRWYLFPINVLGGPIVAVIIIYKSLKGEEFHI